MADESLQIPTNQNLDYHIITLFQRLETMRKDSHVHRIGGRLSTSLKAKYNMQAEIRSLEFWRYSIYLNFLYIILWLQFFDINHADCCSLWTLLFKVQYVLSFSQQFPWTKLFLMMCAKRWKKFSNQSCFWNALAWNKKVHSYTPPHY